MNPTAPKPEAPARVAMQEALGYLNYSSGAADPKFLANLNFLFGEVLATLGEDGSPRMVLYDWLQTRLAELHASEPAFADIEQATAALRLGLERLPIAYRQHHRDLLVHQSERDLEQPFLLGRMVEAVLRQGPPWNEEERILAAALQQLNDYIGYRPVAVLETEQKIEPYVHEWVRPIPLYIAGAGVAVGRYQSLIEKTLDILRQTEPELLSAAWFDPEVMDELALDPRAYDFDHPVNKRPNYHFGQWDPHQIDSKGRYHRFIVQQVTLDSLMARVDSLHVLPREELIEEAATVLAGTMLMASGTCGSGPDAHDSDTTLSTLLPVIAHYRDDFYSHRLASLTGSLGARITTEAEKLRQPLGGARQHLNQELASRRSRQAQQVRLAQLYARMGYPDAAIRKANSVRMASARMLCEMYCRLTLGHRALDENRIEAAADYLEQIEDVLHRAIECGALVDPWNIIGFGGNFSLFPAMENSIHDYRVDGLIDLVEQMFALVARGWSDSAAGDFETLEKRFQHRFEELAKWWDQYATPMVSGVRRLFGMQQLISTDLVAGALSAWHKAGSAAGDVKFWSLFIEHFDTPKAFQLVVEALLEKKDLVASMALMIQWLSQAERIALEDGDSSLHRLVMRWICQARHSGLDEGSAAPGQNWPTVRRLFDYLEANAEDYWRVPELDLEGARRGMRGDDVDYESIFDGDPDDEQHELYSAAYEEMTYRDSTDDGFEGSTIDGDSPAGPTSLELEQEAERLEQRLAFHSTMARLWKYAAAHWGAGVDVPQDRRDAFAGWRAHAAGNHARLLELLQAIHEHPLTAGGGDHDSLLDYDRRRMVKERLLERVVAACVETADAERYLTATSPPVSSSDEGEPADVALLRAVLQGDVDAARRRWPSFMTAIQGRPILYVPPGRGGDPGEMVAARVTQQVLADMLAALPRLGLIHETCLLLQAAQQLESNHPVGTGAVTEFDRLFETGYRRISECIVLSSADWAKPTEPGRSVDAQLVECLQQLTESQLRFWLRHSRTLRLSVVERVAEEKQWKMFVEFVQRYGQDLFTQKFLNLGNLRAILHQGVDHWLAQLEEEPDTYDLRLLDDLADSADEEFRKQSVKHLKVALETVVENYGEYRDYNSTTTQSDRGDLLYTLIDFLRVRADYDRVAWNLRPVNLVHETIVRKGRSEAAELWRRALSERTDEAADQFQARLQQLSEQYGMRLPTIFDRVGERFVQPLAIDRVRALVEPAMAAAGDEEDSTAFSLLSQEIDELITQPGGLGYDLPAWLEALEEEVALIRQRQRLGADDDEMELQLPQRKLSLGEVLAQLDAVSDQES
jgi:hypothetical protein